MLPLGMSHTALTTLPSSSLQHTSSQAPLVMPDLINVTCVVDDVYFVPHLRWYFLLHSQD